MNSLRKLYVKELKDLYDAEDQIIKALPKLIDGASSEELQDALNEHPEITLQQAERIEPIFRNMGEKLEAKKCKGMDGLIQEGNDIISEDMDENVKDAGIISAAQKLSTTRWLATERFVPGLISWARDEAEELLRQTLDEEKEADQKLSDLAAQINVEAEMGEEEEADERAASQHRKPKKSGSRSGRVA